MGTGTKINIKVLQHLKGHNGGVYALQAAPNKQLYSASADGWIVKWDPTKQADGELLAQCGEPIYSLLFHKGIGYAGSSKGYIFVIDAEKNVRKIEAHTRGVFFIKAIKNGFISGGGDGKLNIWDQNMDLLKVLQLSNNSLRCCLIEENKVWIAGSEGKIFELNDELAEVKSYQGHKNSIFAMCQLDGQLISGGLDAEIRHWKDGQLQYNTAAHTLHVHGLAAHPNLPLYASASMDKSCKIWTAEGELLKVLEAEKYGGHINCVNACVWLSDTLLATSSDDRTIMVYEVEFESNKNDLK